MTATRKEAAMPHKDVPASTESVVDVSIEEWADQLGLAGTAVLTIPEAAELLRVSERMLRDLIKDGTVPSIRLGVDLSEVVQSSS